MICFDLGIPIDWNAISAIATFSMTIITFFALRSNQKQLIELKRQWYEANKPRLYFSIIKNKELICLKVENKGERRALNIRFYINDEFLDKLICDKLKESIINTNNHSFNLNPLEDKSFLIGFAIDSLNLTYGDETFSSEKIIANFNQITNESIIITGNYNGNEKIKEQFTISNFLTDALVFEN